MTNKEQATPAVEGFPRRWLFRCLHLLPLLAPLLLLFSYNRSTNRYVHHGCLIIGGRPGSLLDWYFANLPSGLASLLSKPGFVALVLLLWLVSLVLVGQWARRASFGSRGYLFFLGIYLCLGAGLFLARQKFASMFTGFYTSTPLLQGWDNGVYEPILFMALLAGVLALSLAGAILLAQIRRDGIDVKRLLLVFGGCLSVSLLLWLRFRARPIESVWWWFLGAVSVLVTFLWATNRTALSLENNRFSAKLVVLGAFLFSFSVVKLSIVQLLGVVDFGPGGATGGPTDIRDYARVSVQLASDGFFLSVAIVGGAWLAGMMALRATRAEEERARPKRRDWLQRAIFLFVCLAVLQFDVVLKAHFLTNQTNDSHYLMSTISHIEPLQLAKPVYSSTGVRDIWVLPKGKPATFVAFSPRKERRKAVTSTFDTLTPKWQIRPIVSSIPDASASFLRLLRLANKQAPPGPKLLRIVGQSYPAIVPSSQQLPLFPPSLRMFRGLLTKRYFGEIIIAVQAKPFSLRECGAVLLLSGKPHRPRWSVLQSPRAASFQHRSQRVSGELHDDAKPALKQLFRLLKRPPTHGKKSLPLRTKDLPLIVSPQLLQGLDVQQAIAVLHKIQRNAYRPGGEMYRVLISSRGLDAAK